MKKLGPIILGFIIGAVLTYFFCPRQADDMHSMDAEVVKPSGVISVKDAQALNDNWTKFRKPVLDSVTERRTGKEDYRWAWWSLKDIEDYIAFTKVGAKEAGEDFTGLRMYFGAYGDNASDGKKNLSTIFIVPTGTKKTSKSAVLNLSLQDDDDLTRPPLNQGNGGGGGYPQ
ncbi:hypothetical protein EYD45_06595 [Hyunsoonleella flava]|uniref:Uncharacterized protein n=1 Tax=Hyunsoonleella flava TaxID=2527939 RepID=A0A4Q9FGJ7_9FLAO|nr:hypothetical protein [Hyunsoonleella flava]TBN04284.1 hypothetical protein EYD45_06595 [Hyunsoonleella flava]